MLRDIAIALFHFFAVFFAEIIFLRWRKFALSFRPKYSFFREIAWHLSNCRWAVITYRCFVSPFWTHRKTRRGRNFLIKIQTYFSVVIFFEAILRSGETKQMSCTYICHKIALGCGAEPPECYSFILIKTFPFVWLRRRNLTRRWRWSLVSYRDWMGTVTTPFPAHDSVARWYIFKPKIPIWINFGGSYNVRSWSILWPFGVFYWHLVYFSPFWCVAPRKIWQPWSVHRWLCKAMACSVLRRCFTVRLSVSKKKLKWAPSSVFQKSEK
jgi:hypothetical protein